MTKNQLIGVCAVVLAAEVVAGFAGSWDAQRRMKATCDDPAAPTVLDGRIYMCVTKEQWNEVAERLFRMGYASGVKNERGAT